MNNEAVDAEATLSGIPTTDYATKYDLSEAQVNNLKAKFNKNKDFV